MRWSPSRLVISKARNPLRNGQLLQTPAPLADAPPRPHPLAASQISDDQLSALYCTVQEHFTSTRERLKARRATLLFVLPALLLLVRVAVEAVYRHAFPKWWTTVEGQGEGKQRGGRRRQHGANGATAGASLSRITPRQPGPVLRRSSSVPCSTPWCLHCALVSTPQCLSGAVPFRYPSLSQHLHTGHTPHWHMHARAFRRLLGRCSSLSPRSRVVSAPRFLPQDYCPSNLPVSRCHPTATLARMDAAVERIFDPNAYLSHIAPLESTTAAIRIAARASRVIVPATARSLDIHHRPAHPRPAFLCTPHPLCVYHALSGESCRIPSLASSV